MNPLISICIPAYKRTEFLKRLLDSISIQSFQDFEVIVTDDSPGSDVEQLCIPYKSKFLLSHFRNNQPLGTPENWNEAISKATGQWIKLMHDDDWFSGRDSLQAFADRIKANPHVSFIFSAYSKIYLDEAKTEDIYVPFFRYRLLKKNPVTLLSTNIIGPPSVVLHLNNKKFVYDKKLKWLVDIDFYIRYLERENPVYINRAIINVGVSAEQVTKETFRVPAIEIPENFYLLDKVGASQLKNILVYDAWWRLLRNLNIRKPSDIIDSGYTSPVPSAILNMIEFQRKIPYNILKIGAFSKISMSICFTMNLSK
ncbi:MAG TPA: glycosyltransferase family 2 protein [Puia sp.]|jgi:glycosyltransferase involved in cell wall biosynthesis|nr:glycosyltransferase family 2 protein [Puia sp.]